MPSNGSSAAFRPISSFGAMVRSMHIRARSAAPAFPITSQLEGELRVRFANTRYRILYQRSENLVVLLHAIEKDTGADPARRHRTG